MIPGIETEPEKERGISWDDGAGGTRGIVPNNTSDALFDAPVSIQRESEWRTNCWRAVTQSVTIHPGQEKIYHLADAPAPSEQRLASRMRGEGTLRETLRDAAAVADFVAKEQSNDRSHHENLACHLVRPDAAVLVP